MKPIVTRLRYFASKSPDKLSLALSYLGARIQIYGAPVWDGKKWYLWFVPGDNSRDIKSMDLDKGKL